MASDENCRLSALDRYVKPSVRRRVESLIESLSVWREGARRAIPLALGEVASVLNLEAASSYRLSPASDGYCLDYLEWHGPMDHDQVASLYAREVGRCADDAICYDAVRPAREQRNRPVRPIAIFGARYETTAVCGMLNALGLRDRDELRVLLCDGSALLGWFGGWRADTFGAKDAAILSAVAPALQARLRLERDLEESSLRLAALEVALEAIPAAAFLVTDGGRIVHANDAGLALTEASPHEVVAELRDAVSGKRPVGYRTTPVDVIGARRHFLVTRSGDGADFEARCHLAASRWRLTPRESEVMRLVVAGESNATIATKLACRLRTVEAHVTSMLRKAGAERRSELTAMVWRADHP